MDSLLLSPPVAFAAGSASGLHFGVKAFGWKGGEAPGHVPSLVAISCRRHRIAKTPAKDAINLRVFRAALVLVCVGVGVLLAPAAAIADLTISTSADLNVQLAGGLGCTFSATAATANIDVSEIDNCMGSIYGADVEDNISGGGNLVVDAPISPSSCVGHFQANDAVGSITTNSAIDSPGCDIYLTAADSIAANSGITASSLTTTSGSDTTLGAAGTMSNDVSSFKATATDGAITLYDTGAAILDLDGLTATGALPAGVDSSGRLFL